MSLISCYSELAVQLSEKSLCSNYKNVSNSVSTNLVPSIQTATTNLYKATLSTGIHHLITVTWCRNGTSQGLQISSGDDPTTVFRINTSSRLFRKKRGSKSFEIKDSKLEIFYDLSSAQYRAGAEPVERYYVVIMVDSELVLTIGDMSEEIAYKKLKTHIQNAKLCLISRREYFSGNAVYSTKAQFSDAGTCHDILIRCTGKDESVKNPTLIVCIDKRVKIRIKRLRWNFRGNQTIFVDGLSVDILWDVHDWFYTSGSGAGTGSGHAVFMFRTRNRLDGRLWSEDKVDRKDDDEFSLLIYATKS
ncbi:hypothetical protein R6Q57_023987 [Mikania cordata]